MPITALTQEQLKFIERAWLNFETVMKTLPASGTTALLVFHSRSLLDRLSEPPVDFEHIRIITKRVNELAEAASEELGISGVLSAVNRALALEEDG